MADCVALMLCVLLGLVLATADSAVGLVIHRPAFLAGESPGGTLANYGPPKWSGRLARGEVVVVNSTYLCTGRPIPDDATSLTDAVALSVGRACGSDRQAIAAESHGAVGLLVQNLLHTEGTEGDVKIPVERLTSDVFSRLLGAVKQNFTLEVSIGYSLNVLRFVA